MAIRNLFAGSAQTSETYLTASVIGIGLAVLSLYAFLSFSNYQSTVAEELESHTAILERAAVELDGFIDARFLLLEELASTVTINFSDPALRREKVSLFLHRYPEFQKIRIENSAGKDLAAVSRLATLGTTDLKEAVGETAFEEARAGHSYIGRARVSLGAIPSTELAVPITDELGKVEGVIIADLDLRRMWDTVSQIRVGTKGAIYVVDNEGNLVAHPDRQFALTVSNLKDRAVVKDILSEESRNSIKLSSGQYYNERGDSVFAVARALPSGWGVVAEEPKQEFFKASTSVLRLNLIVVGVTTLLMFLLFWSARSFLVLFRELKKERTEKAEIIANLSDGLVVIDGSGKVALVNARARELLLLPPDVTLATIQTGAGDNSSLGILPQVFFPPDAPSGIFKNIGPRRELQITVPNEIYLEIDTVVLSGGTEREATKLLFVLRDITRERILSRLKSEFISIAAHQLRTPLSAIKWALRLVLDGDFGPLTTEQQDYIQSGYETNERMIRLVNDLLNVSRIEEGRFEFAFEKDDLSSITKTTIASFKDLAEKKEVLLAFKNPPKPLPTIPLDRIKIQMVLQNLIENAIDYTPAHGKVEVSIEEKDDSLVVSVRDNGVGIPVGDRKLLFTKFHRSADAIKMQPNGSGLGLFICRNIVVGHGGSVEVESEVGKGSVFRITLPKDKSLVRI